MAGKSQSKTSQRSGGKAPQTSPSTTGEQEISGVETLAFKVLSQNHAQELISMNVDEMQTKLVEIFSLGDFVTDLRAGAILDYYTAAVHWGVQKGMTDQVLSAFFTIVHELLENIREKHLSIVDNMLEFKKLMITATQLGNNYQVGSTDVIDTALGKEITEYIHNSLFQHYNLFVFVFGQPQRDEIVCTDLDVEVCPGVDVPFPPPLDEGIPEDMYWHYLMAPETEESDEVKETSEEEQGKAEELLAMEQEKERLNDLVNVFEDMQPDEVKEIISSVAKEMLSSLQGEVANRLIEKENQILAKINKVHLVDA